MPLLFSYGTLRLERVQREQFGRLLTGRPDRLPGHRLEQVTIQDPAVVAVSGSDRHPVVVPGEPDDGVDGTVFELTDAELAAADSYEVDDYARREVVLASGALAWAYVAAGVEVRP